MIVSRADRSLTVAVADGAGGTTGGAGAAELALSSLAAFCLPFTPCRVLENLDAKLADDPVAGETTLVFATVTEGCIVGTAVGDSGAWLVTSDGITNLAEFQEPKPLLGSGRSSPTEFGPHPLAGRLLLASDGLFDFLPRGAIAEVMLTSPVQEAPARLVSVLSATSSPLADDVAIIVVEQPLTLLSTA